LEGGLGSLHEYTVVDLQQTEKLEDLAGFGSDFIDTKTDMSLNEGQGRII